MLGVLYLLHTRLFLQRVLGLQSFHIVHGVSLPSVSECALGCADFSIHPHQFGMRLDECTLDRCSNVQAKVSTHFGAIMRALSA